MLRIFLAAVLCLWSMSGCSEDNCIANTGTYCDEGVAYWTDSCGELGEIKENCACGCRADHTNCKKCECLCEQVDACCDGCLPVNQAEECDDGDPATEIDMCAAGVCKGFAVQRTEPELPAEPADPAPVHLESWNCPAGWSAVAHDTLTDAAGAPFSWCEPPDMPVVPRLKLGTYVTPLSPGEQDGDRPVCEPEVDGTFPMYGYADCQPLGDPCPAGDWPDIPPEVTGARIYVQAGAAGNGTQTAPYGTVSEAVNQAAGGDVVVIGAGIYPEMVAVDKNLTLWGKCVQQSVIDAPGPYVQYSDGAIMVNGTAQVTVRNLQIGGGQNGVRLNSDNASALLEGVWIHGATREGVSQQVNGGSVTLRGSLIDSMQALADGTMGWGIGTRQGCDVRVESSTIEAALDVGIWSVANTIHLQDALVRNTLPKQAGATGGRGLELQTGANATAERVLFDHNRSAGIAVLDRSVAVLDDLAVHDSQREERGSEEGVGIAVQQGSQLTVRRGQFVRNRGAGIDVLGSGSGATLEVVSIRDTLEDERTGEYGCGILLRQGASLVADRCLLERNQHMGVMVASPNTQAELADVVVLDTRDDQDVIEEYPGTGQGLIVEQQASASVVRGLFEGNHTTGLLVGQAGSILNLERVIVRDTLLRASDSSRGQCLEVSTGGRCEVTGGLFENCWGAGILAGEDGTNVILQDITVRDIQSEESSEDGGVGLWISNGAQVTLTRGAIERNRLIGILVFGSQTGADLSDVTVVGTLPDGPENLGGWGMSVSEGAQATVRRGKFTGNHEAGIGVSDPGSVAQLDDLIVKDTRSRGEILLDMPESGLFVFGGGQAVVTRGLLEGNRTSGILAAGAGTVAELNAVTVRDTLSQESLNMRGEGLWVSLGAYVKCSDALFERNREVGVIAHGSGCRMELERVTIRDTLGQERLGEYGYGLAVQTGAQAVVRHSVLDNNLGAGVVVLQEGSTAELEDVLVANTRSRELDLVWGRGLAAQMGGQAVVRSSVFWKNRDTTVAAHDPGTEILLEQVSILDSLQRDCAVVEPYTCEGEGAGTGLGVYQSAAVTVDAVRVGASSLAGVQLTGMGTLHGSNLVLRGNPIGVNIQDVPADYDFFEEVTDLVMEDNGVNFDTTELYVPDPLDALGID